MFSQENLWSGTYRTSLKMRIYDTKSRGKTNFEGTYDEYNGYRSYGDRNSRGKISCKLVEKYRL